jgi:hypothetical protein
MKTKFLGLMALMPLLLALLGPTPAAAVGCGVAVTLDTLISGGSITCGDMTYNNFGGFSSVSTGAAAQVNASQIFVSASVSPVGAYTQLSIQGGPVFAGPDTVWAIGPNQSQQTIISYQATATNQPWGYNPGTSGPGGPIISVQQGLGSSLLPPASISISNSYYNASNVYLFSTNVGLNSGTLYGGGFTPISPVDSLLITTDILLSALSDGSVQLEYAVLSIDTPAIFTPPPPPPPPPPETPAPPAFLLMLSGLGGLGLLGWRRKRKIAAIGT